MSFGYTSLSKKHPYLVFIGTGTCVLNSSFVLGIMIINE